MKNIVRKVFHIYPRLKRIIYNQYNKLYFWFNGVVYGKRLHVYNKVYVIGQGVVKIGDDFKFTSGDSINPICRNLCGSIYTVNLNSRIEIGDRVGISSACLWAKELIKIGNDVNIGGDCLIMDNDAHPHDYLKRRRLFKEQVGEEEYLKTIPTFPIIIDDDVWIGARCQILKGVHIGARSIIAAGSVVTKDIPADCIAGGNPCKMIRMLNVNERTCYTKK
jgi:acetyltransferase-like isoleucine patch superfamily enzyme